MDNILASLLPLYTRYMSEVNTEKGQSELHPDPPCYFPILDIFVPHTVQVPCVAGLPFFMVTWTGLSISRLVRHLTQYAWVIYYLLSALV